MPEILRGSEPRFEDMVRYMESASEGLAHHFAVEDDELRLKMNIGVVRFRRISPNASPLGEGRHYRNDSGRSTNTEWTALRARSLREHVGSCTTAAPIIP